jgi:hypothetical protein
MSDPKPEIIVTITADDTDLHITLGHLKSTLPRDHQQFDAMLAGYMHDIQRALLSLKQEATP